MCARRTDTRTPRTPGSGGYFARKKRGQGHARIVLRPGAALMTCGMELTVIEAVAMSTVDAS